MSDIDALAALLTGEAGARDDDPMVLAGEQTVTRAELRAASERVAGALRERVAGGTAVGVLAPNDASAIASWFGVWAAGAAFVPLNPRLPDAELTKLVETVGCAHVVAPENLGSRIGLPAAIPDTDLVVVERDADARAVAPGDAIVQLTSGTTGPPTAVPLSARTVLELLDTVIATLRGARSGERARMPNLVPLSLATWGGIYQVLFAFRLGVPVVVMEVFEPREFARLVAQHGIRSSVLPPAALVMLTRDPEITSLAPLRYVRSVAAPLSPVHARAFHDRFGVAVLNGYGQTEIGGEVIGWRAADWKEWGAAKLGAAGRPHAGIAARVRRDGGAIGAPDDVGELELRPPTSLRTDDRALAGRITDDGWLRTGDLARIDADGFVWIEGRVSSMINRGGLKVFPDEVEEALRACPGIADAAVAGVPDDRLGEVPWAFVVADGAAPLDAGTVRAWCRERLAPYKVPAGVTVVDALPRNAMGKVVRHDLVPLADPATRSADVP